MNKEVNEIFDEWKKFLSYCYETNDKTVGIHRDNLKCVMDYTINLQQENKQLKETLKEMLWTLQDEIKNDLGWEYYLRKIDYIVEYIEKK